jgi:uncharacterized protein YdhG (YjbR/CyaY superfamily)
LHLRVLGLKGQCLPFTEALHKNGRPFVIEAPNAFNPPRRRQMQYLQAAEADVASKGIKSVDDYIESYPDDMRAVLKLVRRTIRKAVPEAEEVISYGIPAYKLPGGPVLWFAGWKQHYSLYPVSGPLLNEFKAELAPYKIAKGTIRFPLSQPVPAKLIGRLARFRARELRSKQTPAGRRPKAGLPGSR